MRSFVIFALVILCLPMSIQSQDTSQETLISLSKALEKIGSGLSAAERQLYELENELVIVETELSLLKKDSVKRENVLNSLQTSWIVYRAQSKKEMTKLKRAAFGIGVGAGVVIGGIVICVIVN